MTFTQSAERICDMNPDLRREVISALITLAAQAGGGRSFNVVLGAEPKLEDRKYPGDYYCEGFSAVALQEVVRALDFDDPSGPKLAHPTSPPARLRRRG